MWMLWMPDPQWETALLVGLIYSIGRPSWGSQLSLEVATMDRPRRPCQTWADTGVHCPSSDKGPRMSVATMTRRSPWRSFGADRLLSIGWCSRGRTKRALWMFRFDGFPQYPARRHSCLRISQSYQTAVKLLAYVPKRCGFTITDRNTILARLT